jgi:BA14K-like protein
MNLPSKTLAVALLAATSFAGIAGAAPLGAPLSQDTASPMVQTVQWRGGHRGWGGGWGGRGWGGVGAGLAAGAIIGGAVAASQPRYGYDYSPGYYNYGYAPGYTDYGYAPGGYVESAPGGDVAYCQQRYRSYDPASGTFLGFDGYRHPCP